MQLPCGQTHPSLGVPRGQDLHLLHLGFSSSWQGARQATDSPYTSVESEVYPVITNCGTKAKVQVSMKS